MENIMFNIVAIAIILPGLFTSKSKGLIILFTIGVTVNALMMILTLTGRLVQ